LAVATDFREIIATALQSQFELTTTQLSKIVPNGPRPSRELTTMIRA